MECSVDYSFSQEKKEQRCEVVYNKWEFVYMIVEKEKQ